jgi:D-alanyl-D-alanine carboxypeptidase
VDALAPIDAAPPNLRDEMCGPKRKRPASDADDEVVASNEASSQAMSFFTAGLQPPTLRPVDMIAAAAAPVEPVIVYIGPKKTGADLIAANAVEEARQTPKPKGKKGTKTAAKKPDAAADSKDAKPAAKPAAKQAAVKPDAAAPKPAAAAKPAAAKPAAAKPATAATAAPATTPAKPKAAAKPAPKATTGEAKPAAAAPRT